MAPLQDFLKDIDTTKPITSEQTPFLLIALINQMRVLCECVQETQRKQDDDHKCLLVFRVSRCGFEWIKDPKNVKALTSIIILIWLVCVLFMGSADQVSRMFSHYVFHYP
jgi:hypothetical protein